MATSRTITGYNANTIKTINNKIESQLKKLTEQNSKLPQEKQLPTQILNILAHRRVFASVRSTNYYTQEEARSIILQHLLSTSESVNAELDNIIDERIGDYRVNCSLPIVKSSDTHSIQIANRIYGASNKSTSSTHCSLIEDCLPEVEATIGKLTYEMLRSTPYVKNGFDSLKATIRDRLTHEQSSGHTGGRMRWMPINPGTTTPGTATLAFSSMDSFKSFLVRKSLIGAINASTKQIEDKLNAEQASTETPEEA